MFGSLHVGVCTHAKVYFGALWTCTCTTRAKLRGNAHFYRIPRARLEDPFCTRRARLAIHTRQPNGSRSHHGSLDGGDTTNQSRPSVQSSPRKLRHRHRHCTNIEMKVFLASCILMHPDPNHINCTINQYYLMQRLISPSPIHVLLSINAQPP